MPEYRIISPLKMWNGLSSSPNQQQFMKDLIEEIDYTTMENARLLSSIWKKYKKAIAVLGSGICLTILLVFFSILIKLMK